MTRLSQRRPKGVMRPPPSHVPVPGILGHPLPEYEFDQRVSGFPLSTALPIKAI